MFIPFIDLNIFWSLLLIFGVKMGFSFSKFSKSLFCQGQFFFSPWQEKPKGFGDGKFVNTLVSERDGAKSGKKKSTKDLLEIWKAKYLFNGLIFGSPYVEIFS